MNATWRCRYIAPMVSRTAGASAQLASRSELDAVLSFEMAARQIVRAGERDERHLALQVHRTDGVAHGGRERPVGIQSQRAGAGCGLRPRDRDTRPRLVIVAARIWDQQIARVVAPAQEHQQKARPAGWRGIQAAGNADARERGAAEL